MKKHYVIFISPGTFVSETTQREISSWDVTEAVKISHEITERYGTTPFGFQFATRERGPKDFDSKETERSHTYYLGGKILTLKDVIARNDPNDEILISNMRINKYDRVIENCNSWKVTLPLEKEDVVLDYKPKKKEQE